jgi:hypothetical protein
MFCESFAKFLQLRIFFTHSITPKGTNLTVLLGGMTDDIT